MKRRHPLPAGSIGSLSPALVDLLLTGESPTDRFLEFDFNEEQLRCIWTEHRAPLLAEWRRRGGSGKPWAQYLKGGNDDGTNSTSDSHSR